VCAVAGSHPRVDSAFAVQPAARLPGGDVILLRCHHSHHEHHVWLPCTNAQRVQPATSATKGATTAACFAVGSDRALRALIATNPWLLWTCWTHSLHLISRSSLAAADKLSTGLLDRRPQSIEHISFTSKDLRFDSKAVHPKANRRPRQLR
jgi:hypothetical protein